MATALATRCPACSTVFRVVPDQLRVSEGWVRCGRCAEVFDATASLVDLETGAPRRWADEKLPRTTRPAWASGAPAAAAASPGRETDTGVPMPGEPVAAEDAAGARPADTATPALADAATSGPGLAPLSTPPFQGDEAASETGLPSLPADASAEVPVPGTAPAAWDGEMQGAPRNDLAADPRAEPGEMPSFVRHAERAERWRRPRVRAALAAAALACLALLAGQVTWAYRDLVAARFPQARPVLDQACALLGCRIEPARAIDALAVESSGLVRVERSSIYRLSVSLRNRAGIDVAVPALELALTDTQGQLVARRVLQAAELGAASATLGAGRELALQATLQASLPAHAPVAGYTIELFYP